MASPILKLIEPMELQYLLDKEASVGKGFSWKVTLQEGKLESVYLK